MKEQRNRHFSETRPVRPARRCDPGQQAVVERGATIVMVTGNDPDPRGRDQPRDPGQRTRPVPLWIIDEVAGNDQRVEGACTGRMPANGSRPVWAQRSRCGRR